MSEGLLCLFQRMEMSSHPTLLVTGWPQAMTAFLQDVVGHLQCRSCFRPPVALTPMPDVKGIPVLLSPKDLGPTVAQTDQRTKNSALQDSDPGRSQEHGHASTICFPPAPRGPQHPHAPPPGASVSACVWSVAVSPGQCSRKTEGRAGLRGHPASAGQLLLCAGTGHALPPQGLCVSALLC